MNCKLVYLNGYVIMVQIQYMMIRKNGGIKMGLLSEKSTGQSINSKRTVLAIMMALCLSVLSFTSCGNSEITSPSNSQEDIGLSMDAVTVAFREAGFKNVTSQSVEDLLYSEADKYGTVSEVSINGVTSYAKGDAFPKDAAVIIYYHTFVKYTVNININFLSNLLLNKYDVVVSLDGEEVGSLEHGEDADYQLMVEPGQHTLTFAKSGSSSVNGEITLSVEGDVNASYDISCESDEVRVRTNYVENLSAVGENEIMMPIEENEFEHNDYKDV